MATATAAAVRRRRFRGGRAVPGGPRIPSLRSAIATPSFRYLSAGQASTAGPCEPGWHDRGCGERREQVNGSCPVPRYLETGRQADERRSLTEGRSRWPRPSPFVSPGSAATWVLGRPCRRSGWRDAVGSLSSGNLLQLEDALLCECSP